MELVDEIKVLSWWWCLSRVHIPACLFYEWCLVHLWCLVSLWVAILLGLRGFRVSGFNRVLFLDACPNFVVVWILEGFLLRCPHL